MAKPPKAPPGKPGRPHVFDLHPSFYPHLSDRARQNRMYAVLLLRHRLRIIDERGVLLRNAPRRYCYLLPTGSIKRRAKWDVLDSLGRIKSTMVVKIFADRICELDLPAKQSVALIRDWYLTLQHNVTFAIHAGEYSKLVQRARSEAEVSAATKREISAMIARDAREICRDRRRGILERPADWRLSREPANLRDTLEWIEQITGV